jgi:hypothetical protein
LRAKVRTIIRISGLRPLIMYLRDIPDRIEDRRIKARGKM